MSHALLFPGQGAQFPGMGLGLLDPGSPAHGVALGASELIGVDLVGLACDADANQIRATEVAQPLLLLHSVALLRALPERIRNEVGAVAGHSLGEYTALVASGSLRWQDGMTLVRERGLAMAAASDRDQGMSAVLGLEVPLVEEVVGRRRHDGVLVVANMNAPGQVVISGHLAAIEEVVEPLKAAGARRVMPLSVAGAFHSPLMAPAAARLGTALDAIALVDGRPQAFNVDGAIRRSAHDVREALRAQLTAAVRWTDCIQSLARLQVDRFLELGPGGTLTALGKRILPEATWIALPSLEALAEL